MDVLQVLRFDLGRPLPLHFLRRNSKAGQVDATIHTLAKYAMELTLVEYSFAHIPPSKLAATALAISLVVSIVLLVTNWRYLLKYNEKKYHSLQLINIFSLVT